MNLSSLLHSALTPSTQAAYKRSWQKFADFCKGCGVSTPLPANTSLTALFVSSLQKEGYSPATISSHISAIGYLHKLNGFEDPTASFLVRKLLAACHKHHRQLDVRLPIDKQMLATLLRALEHTVPGRNSRALYQAMFSLAFHAFLRIGEMTVQSAVVANANLLQLDQLTIGDHEMQVTFVAYKHSKNTPFVLTIKAASTTQRDCPLAIMNRYLAVRGTIPGPLFLHGNNTPITRYQFNEQLKLALQFSGFNTERFKSHSFRIGAATAAAAQGASDSQIQQLGRWSSDAFKKYIRCSERLSSL